MRGRKHSDESKRKMAESALGRKLNPEAKAKVSAFQKGRPKPPSCSERMRGNALGLGYRHTPGALAKITKASRNPSARTRELLTAAANRRWERYRLEKGTTHAG